MVAYIFILHIRSGNIIMQEVVEKHIKFCASGSTVQLWSCDSPGETKALRVRCPDAEIPKQ